MSRLAHELRNFQGIECRVDRKGDRIDLVLSSGQRVKVYAEVFRNGDAACAAAARVLVNKRREGKLRHAI